MPLRTLWREHQVEAKVLHLEDSRWRALFTTAPPRFPTLSTAAEATSKLPHKSSAEELTKFRRDHGDGIGCAKFARRQSVGSTCITHSGGPRCDVPDCGKSAQGATGASGSQRCIAHGGRPRCDAPDCGKSARATGAGGIHGRVVLECAAPAHAQTGVLSLELSTNGQEVTSSRSIS
jgi:hypothetical protein